MWMLNLFKDGRGGFSNWSEPPNHTSSFNNEPIFRVLSKGWQWGVTNDNGERPSGDGLGEGVSPKPHGGNPLTVGFMLAHNREVRG
jgi:hypothetical protein